MTEGNRKVYLDDFLVGIKLKFEPTVVDSYFESLINFEARTEVITQKYIMCQSNYQGILCPVSSNFQLSKALHFNGQFEFLCFGLKFDSEFLLNLYQIPVGLNGFQGIFDFFMIKRFSSSFGSAY
jgi:hypothetical protein